MIIEKYNFSNIYIFQNFEFFWKGKIWLNWSLKVNLCKIIILINQILIKINRHCFEKNKKKKL